MSAPSEAGRTRQSPRTRGFAPFSALTLLLTVLSAVPGFAQSWTANYSATEPTFTALDGGYLYVSEHGDVPSGTTMPANGGQILKINLSNGSTTVIAQRGTGNGQFISPDAILVDPTTHNLFIADRWLNRVQEITNTGTYVMQFGSGTVGAPDEMHGPVGLARDSSGAIYVSEHGDTNGSGIAGNVVDKYTVSGTTATQVWKKGNGLNVPYSITYDAANNHLLVSDGFNDQVQVWDTNGTPLGSFPAGGIALGGSLDSSGNFWMGVAGGDYNAPQEIVKFNPATGAQLATFGAPGTGNGQFALPFDVQVDPTTNTAYVADYHNNRIQVINLAATAPSGVPAINSNATASGTVGANFTYQVTATNSPTSYAAVDALPAGLVLNSSTGVISGIPSAAGTTTTHLTATNASGTSAQFALTTTIAAATSSSAGTPAAPLGPTITYFDVSSFTRGVGGDVKVTFDAPVTGVDVSDFAVHSQGGANAVITGVVPDSSTPNSYLVHFTYTDADGWIQWAIKTSGTGIANASSGDAFRGSGITATTTYGTGPTNGAISKPAATATLSAGTPSGNNANFNVTFSAPVTNVTASDFIVTGTSATINSVTDSGDHIHYTVATTASGSGTVSLNVIGGATANIQDSATNWFGGNATSASATIAGSGGTPSAPTISSQTATGTQNQAFSYQVAGSGATSFSITNGTLPAGLSMSSTGLVTGTPSASGTSTVTVQASNSAGNASATLTITIAAAGSAPTISNQTATGTQNSAFSYQVQATGATSLTITTGTLPAGLTMSSTGLISGTPTASGTSTVTVQASNTNGNASATVTITIAAAGSAPTISNQTASGTQNAAFSYQVAASGATSFTLVSGTLPAGLTMNSSGLISGTPSATGTSTVTVKASNANGSAQATVTITVVAAGSVPTISNQTVTGTAGTALNYQVQATGATSYSVATGTLPAGLAMNSSGLITGTPSASGTSSVTVMVTNATGNAEATVTFNISASTPPPPPPPPSGAPVVGSASLSLTAGLPMTYQVNATNSPTSFALSDAPAGLTISKTGVVSGTPFATGTFTATVTATNASGSGTGTLTINVAPSSGGGGVVKKGQTVIFNSPVSAVFVGTTFKLEAEDDTGLPITYEIISGNATLSGNQLLVTGAGPIVIKAEQAGNATYSPASAQITITAQKMAQQIPPPAKTTVHTDAAYELSATTDTGLPISYKVISGPAKVVNGNQLTFTGSGTVVVEADQAGNTQYDGTSSTLTLTANPVPRLINISSRLKVSKGDANGASIAGFVVTGTAPKQILIRAVGPSLSAFHLNSPLADPTLKLFDSTGKLVASNSGWSDDAKIKAAGDGVGAFDLNAGSKDAALLVTLQPGAYTAQVQSADNTGTVLIEVYDVSANAAVPTKQLINISTRGYVGTGDDVLIAGFAVSGNEPKQVLVRGVGPTLSTFKVAGALSDPILTIYDAKGTVVAKNDNWGTPLQVASETPATAAQIMAADTATGAFALQSGSKDAAVVLTLQPGQYSAIVTGANGATGSAMVEVYEIPNP